MKLLMENWRRYVNEDNQSGPRGRAPSWEKSLSVKELNFSHNLFVDYIRNELDDPEHPELVEFIKYYGRRPHVEPTWRRLKAQANKRMHQEWKWDFPHDIAPEMPCINKIFYLDELVKSYYHHPEYYDTKKKAPAVTEAAGGISPYRKCIAKMAAEEELEPYELSFDPEKE